MGETDLDTQYAPFERKCCSSDDSRLLLCAKEKGAIGGFRRTAVITGSLGYHHFDTFRFQQELAIPYVVDFFVLFFLWCTFCWRRKHLTNEGPINEKGGDFVDLHRDFHGQFGGTEAVDICFGRQ